MGVGFIFLASFLLGGDSFAQTKRCRKYIPSHKRNDAQTLTLAGIACFESKQYGLALRHYQRALKYSNTPLLEAALGRTMHELGIWTQAQIYYERYLSSDEAGDDPAGKKRIEVRLAQLNKQIKSQGVRLDLRASKTNTTVYLRLPSDQKVRLGSTPFTTTLAPGKHALSFEKKGYYTATQTTENKAGKTATVEAELVARNLPFNVTARTYKRAGLITILSGIPVITTGGVLWSLGSNKRRRAETLIADRPGNGATPEERELLDSGSTTLAWGQGLVIIGSAAILTGTGLTIAGYVQDDSVEKPTKKSKKRRSLAPFISPSQAGIIWRW